MPKRGVLTKVLAIVGTVLVLGPVVLMFAGARWGAIGTEQFNFDFLMIFEVGFIMVAGVVLLVWAAMRARARRALVWWGIGIMAGSFVALSVVAQVSGLAQGLVEPADAPVWWGTMLGLIALYTAANIEEGVAGVLLIVDLFKREQATAPAPPLPA